MIVHLITLSNGKQLRITEKPGEIGINSAEDDGSHGFYLASIYTRDIWNKVHPHGGLPDGHLAELTSNLKETATCI